MEKNYYRDPITLETLKIFAGTFPKSARVESLDLYEDNGEVSFGAFRVLLDEFHAKNPPPFINVVTRGTQLDINVKEGEKFRSYIACLVCVPTSGFSLGKPVAPYTSLSVTTTGVFEIDKPIGEIYNFCILVETSDLFQPLSLAREVRMEKDLTILVISESPGHDKALKN